MYPRRMRLVKAARRRSRSIVVDGTVRAAVAVALAASVASGCTDGPKPAAALDCDAVLRRMRDPHVVAVLDDGSVAPGPACATGNCLAGADHVFAWRDGDVVHATVGARSVDVPLKQ